MKNFNDDKKYIIYMGIIQFDYENAMCHRSQGIKMLIERNGYIPIIIGVNKNVTYGQFVKRGTDIYEINYPLTIMDLLKSCINARDIKSVIEDIGVKNVYAVIMADYRFIPMLQLRKFCKTNNIIFVVDIMDYFMVDGSLKGIIKKLDNDLRMKLLYPQLDRKIYICSTYESIWGKKKHCKIIPGIITQKNRCANDNINDIIRLFFAGRPGKKCDKEKIDWIIQAFSLPDINRKMTFIIAGVEKEEFLKNNPSLSRVLNHRIHFMGRLTHKRCLEILKKSDFNVVVRPNTKLANYGLSTKIGESFECGIPVLATDTSDNKRYIENGKTGFVCECTYEAVVKMLKQVSTMTREEIILMKKNVMNQDVLWYENYVDDFSNVIGISDE